MKSVQADILWKPSKAFIENSNLRNFENWLARNKHLYFTDYQALWKWSVEETESFWLSVWEYFDVSFQGKLNAVMSKNPMPGVKWFEGTQLNYAEHIFRMRDDNRPAIIFQNENYCRQVSWGELEHKVRAVRQYLISKNIKAGDCIAAYLPNIPEAIISFLAVNSIGAVWSCCSPDFGVDTVIERFTQIEPKLIIAADGYQYNGKPYSRMEELKEIRNAIPSIRESIFINYLDINAELELSINWNKLVSIKNPDSIEFTPVDFNHPIWVLYSSGTTGKPKAITHSHGGVLLEHLKYMAFHNDVKAGEHFFWFTTTGWMMWNFLQASMLMGAIPILYDGSPAKPSLDVLWQLADQLPINHFGTSAPYLTACMQQAIDPKNNYELDSLRSIGSTGAPLPPEVFDWVYKSVSDQVWLCSMSGGTDVCTAFVGGNPYMEVRKGLIQSRALGCSLHAYNEEAKPTYNALGEMVIDKPMPSMPIYFWNDENGKRYNKSYFEDYPGIWRHGDWIKIYDSGSLIIQGRSDATLNRKGVRIGTAEIYNVLDQLEEIKDALVLNLEKDDGSDTMPLFVVLNQDYILDEALQNKIKLVLKTKCSPRHVPDLIEQVPDIPYTLSGKKMEVPVKKLFMKMDAGKSMNLDAIRNPEAMIYFIDLAKSF